MLIYGGLGEKDRFVPGAELLDPATRLSVAAPFPHRARAFHTATLLADGSALIAGGFITPYSTSRRAELFDGRRFVFLEKRMSAPRELHATTLLSDGRALISGGLVGGITSLPRCDIYDPATGAFTRIADMITSRFGHCASVLKDGRVLISGGRQFPGETDLAEAELWDPAQGLFAPTGPMLSPRFRHTATTLPDGRVLLAGGHGTGAQLATTELYDPTTGQFSPGPMLLEARMDHTATLLPDGRVLIAGGFSADGGPHTLASTELFDAATDALRPGPRLPEPVHEHTATLLPYGRVLICGGLLVTERGRSVSRQAHALMP